MEKEHPKNPLAFPVCAAVALKHRWLYRPIDIAPYKYSRLDMYLRSLANSDPTGLGLALAFDTHIAMGDLHSFLCHSAVPVPLTALLRSRT